MDASGGATSRLRTASPSARRAACRKRPRSSPSSTQAAALSLGDGGPQSPRLSAEEDSLVRAQLLSLVMRACRTGGTGVSGHRNEYLRALVGSFNDPS